MLIINLSFVQCTVTVDQSPIIIETGKPIFGVTVLYDEIFLVRDEAHEVEVYDANKLTLTGRLAVGTLVDIWDMTSSVKYSCLYIADAGKKEETNHSAGKKNDKGQFLRIFGKERSIGKKTIYDRFIHRVELRGNVSKWALAEFPTGLSVTPDGWNVIVTSMMERTVTEFTTHGNLVRQIHLQENIVNPLQAVQLLNGQFVICHGLKSDKLNGVSTVGIDGCVNEHCGGRPGSSAGQMKLPIRLCVCQNGSVVVADLYNKRILLVNQTLDDIRELISREEANRPWLPLRMYLDEARGRLLVAECEWKESTYKHGELLVFQLKKR